MASLIGTIRSSLGDQWWFIKAALAVYVVYFAIHDLPKYLPTPDLQIMAYSLLGIIFIGCATVAMNHNITNCYPLFPGFTSILEVIIKTIGSFFVILTGGIITGGIVYLIGTIPADNIIVKYIFYALTMLFMMPFLIIPLVLYSARGKLTDAFRLGIIFGSAGNFIMNFIVFVIQFAIIFVLSYFCLFFFLKQMFGDNHISLELLLYLYAVISFFVSMVYFSDLYDDTIPAIEVKK